MDLSILYKNRNAKVFFAAFSIAAVIYFVFRFFIFDRDPILLLINYLSEVCLRVSLKVALYVIKLVGYLTLFPNHVSNTIQTYWFFFIPEVRYKKLALIVLILIWLTKASVKRKSVFSVLVLMIHFLAITFYNIIGLSCVQISDPELVFSVPDTIAFFSLFTCIVIWAKLNSHSIYNSMTVHKIEIDEVKSKIIPLIVIIYIYIIINQFVFAYFSFAGWVNFLFISTQRILALFGYDAVVDSTYLIGSNGTIYMAKFCLGIKTMYLFAALVFLTGRKNITRWLYIFAGLVFINFFNILRFVFLFIHIQRNGDYTLGMDLHDLYNLVIYSIVFLLWVFWFEKYSDIIPIKKKATD